MTDEEIDDDVSIVNAKKRQDNNELLYAIHENPSWLFSFFLGFQHSLMTLSTSIGLPFLLGSVMCFEDDSNVKGEVLQTMLLTNGINTLIQATFGVRLPIVQGSSFSVLVPVMSFMKYRSKHIPCESSLTANATLSATAPTSSTDPEYLLRFQLLTGSFMVGSLFQILIGFTGLIGVLMRFIGPLTIAPTIALVTLPLFGTASYFCQPQWGVAFLVSFCIVLFSQVLKNIKVPLGCTTIELFKVFPVILSITIGWIFCTILTYSDVFPVGSRARVDHRLDVLQESPWFRFPYPGQWGPPAVSLACVFGIGSGLIASIIESIGDYHACARLAGAPIPPKHAINRGIGLEGIGVFITGAFGTGSGSTSHSENIAAIGITKVGSLRIIQCSAIILIIVSIFGKISAFFTTIPEPVVGGVFIISFGMIAAVGLSSLQFVDLSSVRNMLVLGVGLFSGFLMPEWVKSNGNSIDVGDETVNGIIRVLLATNMFVGGFVACMLDNLLPGTLEERGFLHKDEDDCSSGRVATIRHYDPAFVPKLFFTKKICKYIPFLPYYSEENAPLKYNKEESA